MKNQWMNVLGSIVFFGALWGILEATLGYFLQFFPPHYSGMIMFPLASGLLITAYLQTGSRRSLLAIGLVAAAIKGVNLLMPFYAFSPWKTINPMMSIVLESLLVASVVIVIVSKPWQLKTVAFIGASFGWRALYLSFMAGQYFTTGFLHNDLASFGNIINFTIVHGTMSALLALSFYALIRLPIKKHAVAFQPKTIWTVSLLLIALVLTVFL